MVGHSRFRVFLVFGRSHELPLKHLIEFDQISTDPAADNEGVTLPGSRRGTARMPKKTARGTIAFRKAVAPPVRTCDPRAETNRVAPRLDGDLHSLSFQ